MTINYDFIGTGHIVLPAAPVVAKVTEDLNTATNDKEQIADQEKG